MGGEMGEDKAAGKKCRDGGDSSREEKFGEESEALEKKTRGSSAMRKAAVQALTSHCEAIAEELAKKARDESNVECARLLCDLADEEQELSAALLRRCQESLADKWENEPEWAALIEDAKNDPWCKADPEAAVRS